MTAPYRLRFKRSEVKVLLEHAKRCNRHAPTYDQMYDPQYRFDGRSPEEGVLPTSEDVDYTKVPFGLWLVADHGVYLMSNGEPHDILESEHIRIAYAEGINPDADEFDAWWEAKNAAMGGDDQVVYIEGEDLGRAMTLPGRYFDLMVQTDGQSLTEYEFSVDPESGHGGLAQRQEE